MKDYKDTLLMPRTDFEMKAGLVDKEPKYRKQWLDQKIYRKALEANKGKERFVVHDGPPYANGSLHVGHALNKILKDIIVRYKTMNGFYSPFVPGWDTHGLPIENKMLEELKMSKDDLDKVTLRKEAAKYALKQVEAQKEQFEAMSLFSDLEEKYVTLDKNFEVGQLKLFKKMALDGLVYKGLKPVYWSPSSMSALAEAEVEYEDIRSPQIIVGFDVMRGSEMVPSGQFLIMTTTPWTLPANSGVAVGSEIDYVVVEANNTNYIVAEQLVDSVAELAKWEVFNITKKVKGTELVGMTYAQPISGEESPVVVGHHVTTEAGTGLVHMAPLFGEDDFLIGKEHGLKEIMHVEDDGSLNELAGEYQGQFYADASKDIGMFLDSKGKMLSIKFVKHSYPHDWRTHKPVIFRGTPQWFVSIDKIKGQILDELKKVNSYPEWGTSRISKMIEGRYDWTISRQRTWGVPITIFYDENGEVVIKEDILDHVIGLVAQNGTDIWWEKETDELLPEAYRGKGWTKETDIMDVWFDSGASSIAVPEMHKELLGEAPFELYLEGSDQYRGWFNSSLINSVAYRGKSPYKQLVSHGFVLDGKNQKMSKSKGNVINPFDIINKNGADVLRLWAANAEYTSDVTISDEIIKQTSGLYRNFRTKIRFMLGNLFDFTEKDAVELTGFHELIASQHNKYMAEVMSQFHGFKFDRGIKLLNEWVVHLSGFYLDFAKDSLYADKAKSTERRMFQTNIFNIVKDLIIVLAPIMPTSMEDAYENLNLKDKKESVHLETMKQFMSTMDNIPFHDKLMPEEWKPFFTLKDQVYKAIEEAKKAGVLRRANEAVVELTNDIDKTAIKDVDNLAKMLMVASVQFIDKASSSKTEVKVIKDPNTGKELAGEYTSGSITILNPMWEKCKRCWNHYEELIKDICKRCDEVVDF